MRRTAATTPPAGGRAKPIQSRIPKPSTNRNAAGRNGHDGKAPSTPVCDGAPENDNKVTLEPERTTNGRFAKGNKCGLGNPFARRLGALRTAFLNAVTDADVAAVARKLAALAAAGDVQAAALYLAYAVGKPLPAMNPDRLDLDEFAIADAAPTRGRVVAVALDIVDPAAAAELVRFAASKRGEDVFTEGADRSSLARAALAEKDARVGKPA